MAKQIILTFAKKIEMSFKQTESILKSHRCLKGPIGLYIYVG